MLSLARQVVTADPQRWLARFSHFVATPLIERRVGSDTSGDVLPEELGVDGTQHLWYVPSTWFVLRGALGGRRPGPDDVFVDLGSGKGRVVFAAARLPYRRVIGVELSPRLQAVARRFIERNRHRLACHDVELVTADITEYVLPAEVTTVYMFNAVRGAAFDALVLNLLDLAARRGAPVLFVYNYPTEHERLERTGRAGLVRRVRPNALLSPFPVHVYEVTP